MSHGAPVEMTIGPLAKAGGVGVETVRYYQRCGLIPTPARRGGFRQYGPEALERLQGIRRAQRAGFSLAEIAALLKLDRVRDRNAAHRLAIRKLADIDRQIEVLQGFRRSLGELAQACERGSAALPCPIIEAFQFISAKSSDRVRSAATLIAPSTARAAPKAVLRKPQD